MSGWRHTVSLNFTDGFCKTIWNLGKSLEAMLTAGKAWHMAGPHSSMKTPCPQSLIGEYECLCKGSKSPLIHTPGVVQPWSTLPGMLKIDFQELFYFMIMPFGGTLIDLVLSMKARFEIYTNGHGTSICDNYNECSPKNHERTHRAEVGYHWLQHETI